MEEKSNILRLLKETSQALKNEDSLKLKTLSNQTINTASLSQDAENITVAVIVYTLSKIVERKESYSKKPGWDKFYRGVISELNHSIDALQKGDDKHLKQHIMGLRKRVEGVSGKLKSYIGEVFRKAKVNKASRLYEHGISMETTSRLLGISMFDLANYAGQTGISDVAITKTSDVRTRVKIAMDMFK